MLQNSLSESSAYGINALRVYFKFFYYIFDSLILYSIVFSLFLLSLRHLSVFNLSLVA